MSKMLITLLYATMTLSVFSCANQPVNSPQETLDNELSGDSRQGYSSEEAVQLDNPSGEWAFENRSWLLEEFITTAVFWNLELKGGTFPKTLNELWASGLTPFVLHNRYTGKPIMSTEDYSPGDILYKVDTGTDTFILWRYQGNRDINYDPEATDGKFLPWAGNPRYSTTDGQTIRTEMQGAGTTGVISGSVRREYLGMPPDDDARVAVYIVASGVNRLMYLMSEFIDEVPSTLDEYIAMIGEKNHPAWINPYTREPMKEVSWVSVPLYYNWDRVGDPIEGLTDQTTDSTPDDIAGNYSYSVKPSPEVDGELRAYAQFYFKEPDGSIAAFLAIGLGPEEYTQGATQLDQ